LIQMRSVDLGPCHSQCMRLEHLEIVNFRGICRLALDLEAETTLLFGENAWGKTSLVEALSTVLGNRPLTEADFYRITLGKAPIARRLGITLRFGGEPDPALEGAGWRDGSGDFHLALGWSAKRMARGRVRVSRRFLDAEGRELPLAGIDASLLADRVVASHPLLVFRELRLADWMLEAVLPPGPAVHQDPAQAVQRVFQRMLTAPHQLHPDELARGLEALHQLAEHRPELFRTLPAGVTGRRAEDMADAPLRLQDRWTLGDLAHRAGAGMRQVALLALVGAMLQAEAESPHALGAEPILVLEDPETHLHPIQLATAWSLVAQLPVQKLVTTTRGELLAGQPTHALRRLVRRADHVEIFPKEQHPMSAHQARRVAFHVRTHHAEVLFARVWLLVEGETETWLLPELASVGGMSFPLEGIACVEFAQAGLAPLIAFADRFGIPWHVLADGDEAGRAAPGKARHLLRGRNEARHSTQFPERDIEHFLWNAGYADVFRRVAEGPLDAATAIPRALHRASKPGMALELAEAVGLRGPTGVPPLLRQMFATLKRLAQKG
jgi:putative ATP-dependent endonuclease of the OLD family